MSRGETRRTKRGWDSSYSGHLDANATNPLCFGRILDSEKPVNFRIVHVWIIRIVGRIEKYIVTDGSEVWGTKRTSG
jgi:hypothetical protein